jgi:hypothetical protein
MAELPLLIPKALLLPVAFDTGRIAFTAPTPVLGMAGTPFPCGILAYLPVFRIGGDPATVLIGASSTLAVHAAADLLTRLKLGRLEDLVTISTPPFDHTGVCLTEQAGRKNLETFVALVPRPRRGLWSTTNPVKMRSFYSGN